MKTPLVSILIASYNKEKYLKRCLESCLKQTYKNIEIIMVDNESSDNSYLIASKYKKIKLFKKKRIKKINKFNTFYQIDTYKYAFKKSKGTIITLLDSDDFYKKNKVKEIVNYFNKNNKKKVVFDKPIIYFNSKNKILSDDYQKKRKLISWPKFPPTSCISIKKDFFLKLYNELSVNKFNLLTIDFRIAVVSEIAMNDFNILNKHLTYYFQDISGESNINFKKFSRNWWMRRMQAHKYVIYLLKKYHKFKNTKNLDYYITSFLNKLFIIK